MRLRQVPVENKVCADCGHRYEGGCCPGPCDCVFDPQTTRKEARDLLVLVGSHMPLYERRKRCKCPACGNLYELSGDDVTRNVRCQCGRCGEPFFSKDDLRAAWRDAKTLLGRARRTAQMRQGIERCPHCDAKLKPASWCPLCGTHRLPQNMTHVWVRTSYVAANVGAAQQASHGQDSEYPDGQPERAARHGLGDDGDYDE